MKPAILAVVSLCLAACALVAPAAAQPSPGPQPVAMPEPIPAARDVPYPGVLKLDIDATDVDRRIFRVRETVPVSQAGRLTLLFPAWVPGGHTPRNTLDKIAGLTVRANGRDIPWSRDLVSVHAVHVQVPAGAQAIELEFQFLSPTAGDQGRTVMTPEIVNLQWIAMVFYPAGHYVRRIEVDPSMRLPAGWKFGTALETAEQAGGLTRFRRVDLETLVDSPIFAGRYFRQIDLDPGGRSPVRLNIVADSPELLDAAPVHIAPHRELVRQADKLFGARHFDHYDFLLALTDRLGGVGLEHHRSSENSAPPEYFTQWGGGAPARNILPHEYSHSWNGKFRRPADLWTPDFNTPMRGSLLWLYEGQDQYWGYVLGARSGLSSLKDTLDALAITAAGYSVGTPGRRWRPLQDTTEDPVIAQRRPQPWRSWQRSEDYYFEGQLIWLDVDTLIRERTDGRRSLDDFAKAFFGMNDGDWTPLTYTFDDVVAALNKVTPYDWATFLAQRTRDVAPEAPLDGLARGGYRLVFTERPTEYFAANEAIRQTVDLTYSIGLTLGREGTVSSVLWDGPAFKAGMTVDDRIVAVNGIAFDIPRLKTVITAAKAGGEPISLIIRDGEHYRVVTLDYRGGLRYPRLERIAGAPDRLSAIFAPRP